ncbi:MAG TPA: RidA family protein [Methylomirabilota bacterium]|jgi:2-iminobutanoate/2-iminopropanoate deaminase|nr:RidA family protein [Methylomirabilota bacterium]
MKSPLHVEDAPKAIGPYSQAQVVRMHGGQKLVYTSGQVGIDPKTGDLVPGGIQAETRRVMQNLANVLRGANLSLADVVKTTVFLADMGDFAAMNEIYGQAFGPTPPARTTVAAAGLPKNARVEVECVAVGRDL